MSIEISEIDCVMVEDEEGVGETGARSLGKLTTSPTLVRGCQDRRRGRGRWRKRDTR